MKRKFIPECVRERKQKAVKKAAKTRARNKAQMNYIRDVTQPGAEHLQEIMQAMMGFVRPRMIRLRYLGAPKLMHDATEGVLVGFRYGHFLIVRPDGYKQAKHWHPAFWELAR